MVPAEDEIFRFGAGSARRSAAGAVPGAPAELTGEYAVDAAWTPALQELVLAAMVYAFDNIPPQETEGMLMGWCARSGDGEAGSLRKLAALSRQLEALGEADRRGAPQKLVADEARTLRSQIRCGARTASGMRADDSWLAT